MSTIYSEDGHLLTELNSIVERWGRHYSALGSDGESPNWTQSGHGPLGVRIYLGRDIRPELESLNRAFSKEEMWTALKRMKHHKAPGRDNIPADFLKACLFEKERVAEHNRAVERAQMAKAIALYLQGSEEVQGESWQMPLAPLCRIAS